MTKRERLWPYIEAVRALYAKTRQTRHFDFYLTLVDMQAKYHHNIKACLGELGVEIPDFNFAYHSRLEEAS